MAFLNAGLQIDIKDEKKEKHDIFRYDGGVSEFVSYINRNKNVFTFVNNINTHEGGTHLFGFKGALT